MQEDVIQILFQEELVGARVCVCVCVCVCVGGGGGGGGHILQTLLVWDYVEPW